MTKAWLKIKLEALKRQIDEIKFDCEIDSGVFDVVKLKSIYKNDGFVCIDSIVDFANLYSFVKIFDVDDFKKAIDEYFDYMVEAQELE